MRTFPSLYGSLVLLAVTKLTVIVAQLKDLYPFANITSDKIPDLPENLPRQMSTMPRDCAEILDQNPETPSGVYTIYPATCPSSSCYFHVYCDMEHEGGGWTVIQRRCDGTVDFYRGWYFYKMGFGNVNNEYYLGNERIHWLTTQKHMELKIKLTDVGGMEMTAGYSHFRLGNESTWFTLFVDTYYGDAGDFLSKSNGSPFSTFDHDYDGAFDKNCAAYYHSAWWYPAYGEISIEPNRVIFSCAASANLNGYYFLGKKKFPRFSGPGFSWRPVPGHPGPALMKVLMKIRPMGFYGGSFDGLGDREIGPEVPTTPEELTTPTTTFFTEQPTETSPTTTEFFVTETVTDISTTEELSKKSRLKRIRRYHSLDDL